MIICWTKLVDMLCLFGERAQILAFAPEARQGEGSVRLVGPAGQLLVIVPGKPELGVFE